MYLLLVIVAIGIVCGVKSDTQNCGSCPTLNCSNNATQLKVIDRCCPICSYDLATVLGRGACVQDGVAFPLNSNWRPARVPSNFPSEENRNCITCICIAISGRTLCHSRRSHCPSLGCQQHHQFTLTNECCPRCLPDTESVEDAYDASASGDFNNTDNSYDDIELDLTACIDEVGKTRGNGDCWHVLYLNKPSCLQVCCEEGRVKTAERNCTSDIADCEDGKLPNMDICGCPSCKPKMDIGTGNEFPLKECGKLTYRIYLAHPQILDAWVYQNVTSQSFHLVLYNHEGGRTTVNESSHSLQPFCNRSDFNLFIYRGRTTEDLMAKFKMLWTRGARCSERCAISDVKKLQPTFHSPSTVDC